MTYLHAQYFNQRTYLFMKTLSYFAFALAILVPVASHAQLAFKAPVQLATNWDSRGTFVADFDGDGKPDLASYSSGSAAILYGEGNHEFTKSIVEIVDGRTHHISAFDVADVNEDGKSDFVAFITGPNFHVVVFLSTGRGFIEQTITVGPGLVSMECIRIADLDKDGKADVVGVNGAGGSLYFLKGNGTGQFAVNRLVAFSSLKEFVIADLNSDGVNDIVATDNENEMEVYLGGAANTFTKTVYTLNGMSLSMAVADFSGDNVPDVATVSYNTTSFAFQTIVHTNNGDAVFTQSPPLPAAFYQSLAVVDYNADGKNDIVGTGLQQPEQIIALRNDGGGVFTAVDIIENPSQDAATLSAGDFDNNGDKELIVATPGGAIYVKDFVDTKFRDIENEVFGLNVKRTATEDMNNDGFKDIVTGNAYTRAITILYGDANQSFTTTKTFALTSELNTLAVADFNSDTYPDIAYTCLESGATPEAGVIFSTSLGGYEVPQVLSTLGHRSANIVDFNVDGKVDIVFENKIFLSDGAGIFTSLPLITPPTTPGDQVVADIDNDGFPDIAINGYNQQTISFNNGSGQFTSFTDLLDPPFFSIYMTAAFINEDQLLDFILIAQEEDGQGLTKAKILINNGNRQFTTSELIGPFGWHASFADFNEDGRNDIVTSKLGKLFVYLQNTIDGFDTPFEIVGTSIMYGEPRTGVEDLNGDGKTDIFSFTQDGAMDLTFNDFVIEPSVQPIITSHDFTDVSATFAFEKGDGTGRLLLLRKTPAANNDVPADGVFYAANNSFPLGSLVGAGNHVVMRSDETLVNITGLEEGTEYQLVAFEYSSSSDNTVINYNPTTPATFTFTTRKNQTISFEELLNTTFSANPITIHASATSGLTVALQMVSGSATISGDQVTALAPGPMVIKGMQAGNDEYMAAPEKEFTFFLYPAQPTALAIEERKDVSVKVMLTAGNGTGRLLLLRSNLSSNDLPLDGIFYEANSYLPQGAQIGEGNHVVMSSDATSVNITGLEEGTEYQILAFEYIINQDNGQINYTRSLPAVLTFTTKKNQVIAFEALPTQTFSADAITINASATSELSVELAILSGGGIISGSQFTASAPGPIVIKGTQAGDDEYMPAPEKEFNFFLYPAQPTSLAIEELMDHSVTVTLTPGNGDGRLLLIRTSASSNDLPLDGVFYGVSALIGAGNRIVLSSDANSVEVSDLEEGTEYEILAFEYWTNENNTDIRYSLASHPTVTFTTKKNQSIAIEELPTQVFSPNAITINTSATSDLPVALTVLSGNATFNGNLLIASAPGPIVIKGTQGGDDEYMPAPDKEFSFFLYPAQASALTIEDRTDVSATATLVKGNGSGRLILIRTSTASNDVPVDGIFYGANAQYGAGDEIGAGNYVVTSANVSSVAVTNLEEGTEYEIIVFEYWRSNDNTDIKYTLANRPAMTFSTKKNQTIAFVGLLDETFGLNAITINASTSSGLDVALAVVSGPATITGNQLTATSPGPMLLKGSQTGDAEYMPAPDKEFSFCVYPPVPTVTVDLANDPSPKLTSSASSNNQWFLNGEAVDNATSQDFLPATDGIYTVKVDYSGCARTSSPTGHVIAGIIEEEVIHVFPNPVASRLMITLAGKSAITVLSMTDMQGRLAPMEVTLNGSSAEVNVQGLAEGVYVLRVTYDGGIFQQKVLKIK
jgi:hypothetical protein